MKFRIFINTFNHQAYYYAIFFLLIAVGFFVTLALNQMRLTPFNEFDEAHRAENAKKMWEYRSFFVPLTGSVFDRITELSIPIQNDEASRLYLHLERPPLVYDLMILSVNLFGSSELSYRLPSFLFGLAIILSFLVFTLRYKAHLVPLALSVSFLSLLTSSDLWLSSQYAQLDTGLSLSLFLALVSLTLYIDRKNSRFLMLSGVFLGIAVLCKGQMAILFIWPVLYLLYARKIRLKQLLILGIATFITISPWIIYLSIQFGLLTLLLVFSKFGFDSASILEIHHKAPFFWYLRWWWESFRPGWTLFLALLASDIYQRRLTTTKLILISYILGNLAVLSLPENKLWWYTLPLVAPICFYIFLSIKEYLLGKQDKIINLAIVLIIASRPSPIGVSNTIAMFYGIASTILSIYILDRFNISLDKIANKFLRIFTTPRMIILAAIIFSTISFWIRFPEIIPYHWNIKPVSEYYASLPGKNCLWVYSMPPESVLFYSNAGEVFPWNAHVKKYDHCRNYIITSERFREFDEVYQLGGIRLYSWK